ncbi:transposase [soil metagenome]
MDHKSKYNPQIHHRRSIRLKGYDYSQAGLYFITICCQDMICRFGNISNKEMILNEFGKISYDEWLQLPQRFPNFVLDVFQIMPNHMHGIIALNVGAGFTPAQNNDHDGTGQPQGVTGQPQGVTGQPHDATGQPHDGTGQPHDGTGQPHDGTGQPHDGTGQPHDGTGQPPDGTGQPHDGTGQPHDVTGQPPDGTGQPQGIAPTATVGDIVGAYKSLVSNACLDIYKSKNEMMGKFWQRNYYEHIIKNEQSYKTISNYIITNPANWKDDKFYK